MKYRRQLNLLRIYTNNIQGRSSVVEIHQSLGVLQKVPIFTNKIKITHLSTLWYTLHDPFKLLPRQKKKSLFPFLFLSKIFLLVMKRVFR